jgi:hypothetical protein
MDAKAASFSWRATGAAAPERVSSNDGRWIEEALCQATRVPACSP